MAKDNAFRFAVRNDIGQHSQQWRIWTRNNDCYIGSRATAQSYKASLHESGQCQVGLSSEIRDTLVENPEWKEKSRLYDQWRVNIDLTPGSSIKYFELVIPHSQLDNFRFGKAGNVSWITCPKGKAVSVGIFKANIQDDQTTESTQEQFLELCRLPLSNGYSILVLSRIVPETTEHKQFISNVVKDIFPLNKNSKTYINGPVDPKRPSIRVMIWHKNSEERYWIEASLRKTLFEL